MPIFKYRCEQCGHQFEKLVRNSESQVKCDKCESENLTKLFTGFAAKVGSGSSSSFSGEGGCGSGFG
jgi:putative FmdB family regulatory protein